MDVAGRITECGPSLTPAERRVADVVLQRPQLVAFGTVAELANEAGSGAATVVRLAGEARLRRLHRAPGRRAGRAGPPPPPGGRAHPPARGAGRHRPHHGDRARQRPVDPRAGVDREAFTPAVAALSQRTAQVAVLSGRGLAAGIARQAVGELALLRDGVELVVGTEVAVVRSIALLGRGRRLPRRSTCAATTGGSSTRPSRAGERGATRDRPDRQRALPPRTARRRLLHRRRRQRRAVRLARGDAGAPQRDGHRRRRRCGPRPPTASTASRPRGGRRAPSSSPESAVRPDRSSR